jgi:hypothetical protein
MPWIALMMWHQKFAAISVGHACQLLQRAHMPMEFFETLHSRAI